MVVFVQYVTSLVVIYISQSFILFQSNVLCSDGHCYLTDFGVHKILTWDFSDTLAQPLFGWAAPELDEQTDCSKQSDIFSFACTIYEVLVYFPDLWSLFTYLCS